ncbi:uncharacterized protein [Physcomitrium patens]|uniref:uncharacterized protein isoform X5 n=1 Tax=Physcomitrium patens TaxID=3218 RepID=UPI003CCE4E19
MFLQSLLVLFQDWAFWQMMYPGCMQSEYGDVMCNGSNGGTVFKFKEEAAFLAGKDGMEGQCAAMNTSAPLPDTNPANKNAPISAKSVYIAVLLDIGAAWNHWNQKSHSEFFINR